VHLVKTEPLTAVQRAFCTLFYTSRRCFRLLIVQDIWADKVHFNLRLLVLLFGPVQLWAVFMLASSAAHKNQHSDVVSCRIVCKMHFVQLLLLLSSLNTEQTNSY
jgi:hypothetical protein